MTAEVFGALIFMKRLGIFRKKNLSEGEGSGGQGQSDAAPETMQTRQKAKTTRRRERIKIDLLIHDLKVPLAVIEAGITSLLSRTEKYGALTDKQIRVLKRALRNTKVTQALVSDALELGRSREGIINLSRCRLSELIGESLVEVFDLSHGALAEEIRACTDLSHLRHTLSAQGLWLDVGEDLWRREVTLDVAKVRQILRNLLSNALKYRKSRVDLEVRERSGLLELAVGDDGEGIPAGYHRKIFECYFQMEAGAECPVRGHGLGLAGVMVLLEDMGGSLALESDTGKGAKFIVRIPLGTT